VRSIVEVLEYGLGLQVSVGYVQGVISQAGLNAHSALARLLQVVPLSGAISVDEVYLKELGQRIFGIPSTGSGQAVIVVPLSGLILRLTRCGARSKATIGIGAVLQQFAAAGFRDRIKLCLSDMYEGYVAPLKSYLPQAVHQFCWFHFNCFHLGATVRRAARAYQQAVEALTAFVKQHPSPLTAAEQSQRQALLTAQEQAHRHWRGAQRCQRLLLRLLCSPSLAVATVRLEQLLRVAPKVANPYVQAMATFVAQHRHGLLRFYACLVSGQHLLQRLSRSQQQWVALTVRWALPLTTNAAEHVFRCLRRYTHAMDHFGADEATQRFFDLFAFFHNVHILRAGQHAGSSLLATAHVDVKALFGTDDPYTMLGFPPAAQAFTPAKSVQSVAA
jgi:hypothetical protein